MVICVLIQFSSFPLFLKVTGFYRPVKPSLKGGHEPLEKEINEILGSKREDRLSDPFF